MSTLPGGGRWPLVKMADARAGHMAVPPQARSQGPPGSALSRPWGGHPCQLTSCWLRPHGPLQRLQHPHWGRGSQVCRVSSSVSVFDLVSCCLRLDTFLNLDSGLERPEAPLSPRGRCGHRENGDLAMFPLISLPLRPSRSLPGPAEWRLLLPAPARGVRAQPAGGGRRAGEGGAALRDAARSERGLREFRRAAEGRLARSEAGLERPAGGFPIGCRGWRALPIGCRGEGRGGEPPSAPAVSGSAPLREPRSVRAETGSSSVGPATGSVWAAPGRRAGRAGDAGPGRPRVGRVASGRHRDSVLN